MNTNIPYRERYIRKAEKLFGKDRYYVCCSEETYQEFIDFIKSLKNVPKKNRMLNKMRDWKRGIR